MSEYDELDLENESSDIDTTKDYAEPNQEQSEYQEQEPEEDEEPKSWRKTRAANVKKAQSAKASYQRTRKTRANIEEYKVGGLVPELEEEEYTEEVKVTKARSRPAPIQQSSYEQMLMDQLLVEKARNQELQKKPKLGVKVGSCVTYFILTALPLTTGG